MKDGAASLPTFQMFPAYHTRAHGLVSKANLEMIHPMYVIMVAMR